MNIVLSIMICYFSVKCLTIQNLKFGKIPSYIILTPISLFYSISSFIVAYLIYKSPDENILSLISVCVLLINGLILSIPFFAVIFGFVLVSPFYFFRLTKTFLTKNQNKSIIFFSTNRKITDVNKTIDISTRCETSPNVIF